MRKILVLIGLCLVFLIGCSKTGTETPAGTADSSQPAQHEKSILIGLIPERNLFRQLELYEPLADYLSAKTGIEVKLKILARYGNIIDNFVSADMDGAFFGSFTYALAHAKLGVEPLARPEDANGVSVYHGLIFVRKDSGIRSAKDMNGKVFAFVDKATTAGYLLPLTYFKKHGIIDYKTYFKETYFAGTHENVIYDVFSRKADIGAAKNTVFEKLLDTDNRLKNELVALTRSPDVPQNGLAVRKDLNPAIKTSLKETLLNMHLDPEGARLLKQFGAKRFIETTDNDYAGVYDYARKIDLNLATYDYVND